MEGSIDRALQDLALQLHHDKFIDDKYICGLLTPLLYRASPLMEENHDYDVIASILTGVLTKADIPVVFSKN